MRVLLCALLLFLVSSPAHAETVYDRVMKSGTIRCGYGVIDPYLMKDPNTGEFSGIYYEYMQLVGEALNLKVEWTEEVGWGDFVAGLKQGRFDAFCTICWPSAERARETDFISPIAVNTLSVYSQVNDNRFDNAIDRANTSNITFVSLEGQTPHKTSILNFPSAKHIVLPQISNSADVFLHLSDGKADLTLAEDVFANNFMKNNPGKIRKVQTDQPIRYAPNGLSIKADEYRFKRLLDVTTEELHTTGQIDKILNKYENQPNTIRRVAKPYQTPAGE